MTGIDAVFTGSAQRRMTAGVSPCGEDFPGLCCFKAFCDNEVIDLRVWGKALENINLNLFEKDGDKILEELGKGNMVIARSKNEFLYIVDFDNKFHMFSHTPGAPGGGQKQFPKDEKYTAVIHKLAILSDSVYLAEFDKDMNIYGVMASAEEGILSLFPGDDRDKDLDSDIEFILPGEDTPDNDNQ